jgi:hypothetical protein
MPCMRPLSFRVFGASMPEIAATEIATNNCYVGPSMQLVSDELA